MKKLLLVSSATPHSVGHYEKFVDQIEVFRCFSHRFIFQHHCRQCQKIFCYYCSNNWVQNPKLKFALIFFVGLSNEFCFSSPAYRVCDFCNDKLLKESFTLSTRSSQEMFREQDNPTESVDTRFEVRSEKLPNPPTN